MKAGGGTGRPSPQRDPGAQPERTRLSWRRTTLTFLVCVGLLARTAISDQGRPATVVAVSCGALAWAGFLAVTHRRAAALRAARPSAIGPGPVAAGAVCALVLIPAAAILLV